MRITSLHTYPVKGCHRLDHDAAHVEPWGLAGDRRWMIIDPEGVGITQRDAPELTRLSVTHRPGGLLLNGTVAVDEPAGGPETTVRIFSSQPSVPARLAPAATAYLSDLLGQPARLAWLADPTARPLGPNPLDGDWVNLADGFPLLLTTVASLDAVNDWLIEAGDEAVPMTRFRPNVVVSGARAWAEDDWLGGRLRLGDVTFRAAQACSRCVVTTIDQETGEAGRQPLHTLGDHRRYAEGLLFGINLIPDVAAGETRIIRVGDAVLRLP
jgi:uncharacterized protein YcbX